MIEMTVEQTIAYLDEIVAEFGKDYVYDRGTAKFCHYFESNGIPSCIVGQVFAKYGIKPSNLTTVNSSSARSALDHLTRNGIIAEPSPAVYVLLGSTQNMQDYRKAWGAAVEYGKSEAVTRTSNV